MSQPCASVCEREMTRPFRIGGPYFDARVIAQVYHLYSYLQGPIRCGETYAKGCEGRGSRTARA